MRRYGGLARLSTHARNQKGAGGKRRLLDARDTVLQAPGRLLAHRARTYICAVLHGWNSAPGIRPATITSLVSSADLDRSCGQRFTMGCGSKNARQVSVSASSLEFPAPGVGHGFT